jgi:hypothetical protein
MAWCLGKHRDNLPLPDDDDDDDDDNNNNLFKAQ